MFVCCTATGSNGLYYSWWLLSVVVAAGLAEAMTSTLVATVSINYEDFSESFLTCSTCLCHYDASLRRPKLLPCSHTICSCCLERISLLPQVCSWPFIICENCYSNAAYDIIIGLRHGQFALSDLSRVASDT